MMICGSKGQVFEPHNDHVVLSLEKALSTTTPLAAEMHNSTNADNSTASLNL